MLIIWTCTPATPIDAPTYKILAEDMIQAQVVARQLMPGTLEKEPMEESSPINELGEYYLADVQCSGEHIPLHCTDVEEHEHLTKHFNEQLNANIVHTFTDLFSNVNVDSIQETYPKISIYKKIMGQHVEETNIKYGLN